MSHRKPHALCKVSTLSLAVAATCLAGTSAAAEVLVLEEVLVVAQKREQRLQDVPVAVSAIPGNVIEQLGMDRMEDLEQLSPSLSVSSGSKNTNGGFSIRGIGTNGVFGIQTEPAVLVVFDDVSQAQGGQALTNIIDVERIEVLRGPQNTLFGKNASAGVINIVSRSPADVFEGLMELTATDDDELAVNATLSGPVTDSLGYRLTGLWSDRDGFIDNITDGDDIHDRETLSLRGKLRWTPGDDWDITLAGNYSEVDEACCALVVTSYHEDAAFLAPAPISILYSDMVPGIAQDDENNNVALDNPVHQETDSEGLSLKVDYSLDEFTLTSITAYNKWENTAGADQDYSDRDVPGDLAGLFSIRVWDNSQRESEFTSQEFRLLSPAYDRLDYVLGLYYSKTENTQKFDRFSEIGPFTADNYQETETESWAIFGQANWQLGAATTLTTGLRYNDEEISAEVTDFIDDTRNAGKDSDDVWLGKLSLQRFVWDDNMLYASFSTGYKGQAFDTAKPFDEEKANNPVKPEESTAYEFGIKSRLWDDRMELNAALFFTQYEDFQAQDFVVLDDGSIATQLVNVGELETKGLEVEGMVLLSENFRMMFGLARIDAEVTEWDNAPCYVLQTVEEGCDTIVGQKPDGSDQYAQASAKGNQLQNSPDWKLSIAGDYLLTLPDMPFDGFLNFNYVWRDEVSYDIKGSPRAVQDSFGIANLSLGIVESASEKYRVTFFVNNLFDEFHSSSVTDALSGQLFTEEFMVRIPTRAEQRYMGLRLRYAF